MQHDGIARLQSAERGLQLLQILDPGAVDGVNIHVSCLWAFAQQRAGGSTRGHQNSRGEPQVVAQGAAKIVVMVTPTIPSRFTMLSGPVTISAKRSGSSVRSITVTGMFCTSPLAARPPQRSGRPCRCIVERELPQILDALAADAGDDPPTSAQLFRRSNPEPRLPESRPRRPGDAGPRPIPE